MSKNKIGEDSPIPKFLNLKIRRRDGVESLTTLKEGDFKVPIDGCINIIWQIYHHLLYLCDLNDEINHAVLSYI